MQEEPTKSPLVCIVDDDPSVGRSISRLLSSYGLPSRQYTSAQTFLKEKGFSGAACLILDIHMPRMSGYELANRLAEESPEVPIIFITARAEELDRWQNKASSAMALLIKPFSEREFSATLEQALGYTLAAPT